MAYRYVKITHDLENRLEDYNFFLDKVAAIIRAKLQSQQAAREEEAKKNNK